MSYTENEKDLLSSIEEGNLVRIKGLIIKNKQGHALVDLDVFRCEDRSCALSFALKYTKNQSSAKIIDEIVIRYPKLLEKLSQDDLHAITLIILKADNLKLFYTLLKFYQPSKNELNLAEKNIKSHLDYARKIKALSNEGVFSDSFMQNPDIYEQITDDLANTTDESDSESSDDDESGYQGVANKVNAPSTLLVRGFNFSGNFDKTLRKKATKSDTRKSYHYQDVYSNATIDLANKHPQTNYLNADKLVKNYFELLKMTPDKRERKANGAIITPRKSDGQDIEFDSLYERLLQVYVNSYNALFTEQGMTCNFNFYNNLNPFISTFPLDKAENTKKFILGEAMVGNANSLRIKARKTTQSLKHKHIGYIQVYAIPEEIYEKTSKSSDVKGLGARRETYETMFESSIPAEYIIGYINFSVPSFKGEWTEEVENKYGITKKQYNDFKKNIRIDEQTMLEKRIKQIVQRSFETQWESFSVFFKSTKKVLKEATKAVKPDSKDNVSKANSNDNASKPDSKDSETLIGLTYERIPKDGHCLFHAVGLYLGESAEDLRKKTSQHMEENFDYFKAFIEGDEETFKKYIERIRNEPEWGGNIEIEAIQRITQRPIIIIRGDAQPTMPNNLASYAGDPIFVFYTGSHYDAFTIENGKNPREILQNIQGRLAQGESVTYLSPKTHTKKPLIIKKTIIKDPELGTPVKPIVKIIKKNN